MCHVSNPYAVAVLVVVDSWQSMQPNQINYLYWSSLFVFSRCKYKDDGEATQWRGFKDFKGKWWPDVSVADWKSVCPPAPLGVALLSVCLGSAHRHGFLLHLIRSGLRGQGLGPCQIPLTPRASHTIKSKSHAAYETGMEEPSSLKRVD